MAARALTRFVTRAATFLTASEIDDRELRGEDNVIILIVHASMLLGDVQDENRMRSRGHLIRLCRCKRTTAVPFHHEFFYLCGGEVKC